MESQSLTFVDDVRLKDASSLWLWLKYAKANDEELRQDFPEVFGTPEFRALRQRRIMLVRVAARVSPSFDT